MKISAETQAILFNDDSLSGLDRIVFSVEEEEYLDSGGVIYLGHISREDKRPVGFDIVINLDIVCVPDVVLTRYLFCYLNYSIPIVIALKLVGVTPEVEELG